ncbi:hypothetical protein [Microcoleus sp.]|uniref:hypothetical protein n=1 Tax=Microcoleus sp. TaxID=44472 RepID=UPI00403E949D
MAVTAVGSEIAKRCFFTGVQTTTRVQTTVRDLKVKERKNVSKVFGRSPQALYNLL